jgi:hypothetical protein
MGFIVYWLTLHMANCDALTAQTPLHPLVGGMT